MSLENFYGIERKSLLYGNQTNLLYDLECWTIKKSQVRKLMVVEMRMIRWMCGYTRLDRLWNETIRKSVGVAPTEDKLRESRLRRFGHVRRLSLIHI